ncbi:MAG: Gx transporter family protein [Oscillospiraceae bacterium]|nr:Gx transporter family protein [Oscillospiraceae bacterium]
MAILTAIALIIFIIEAQIPMPIPVPGVKLGLANAVTLFALFYGAKVRGENLHNGASRMPRPINVQIPYIKHPSASSPSLTTINVFTILLCRILLGAIFTGRPIVVVYSLVGGILGFVAQIIMKRFVSSKQIWVCGAFGAVFHNIGQIVAAMVITGTPAIIMYLPILIIAGVFTGVLTGLIAQLTLSRLFS